MCIKSVLAAPLSKSTLELINTLVGECLAVGTTADNNDNKKGTASTRVLVKGDHHHHHCRMTGECEKRRKS